MRFRFRDEVDEPTKAHALSVLQNIASSESVVFSVIGQDLEDPAAGYTHSYCIGLPDLAALARYLREPVHCEGDRFFLPLLAKLSRSASSDDLDPGLRDKIGSLVRQRLEDDPEWAALLAGIPDVQLG
ncbi:Dabb family protein [Nannocystis pusilla]|uniref:Dabb family protein n=1 Tax=Nannocystis pusilla TaxID=889268 RepID=UPI003B771877